MYSFILVCTYFVVVFFFEGSCLQYMYSFNWHCTRSNLYASTKEMHNSLRIYRIIGLRGSLGNFQTIFCCQDSYITAGSLCKFHRMSLEWPLNHTIFLAWRNLFFNTIRGDNSCSVYHHVWCFMEDKTIWLTYSIWQFTL